VYTVFFIMSTQSAFLLFCVSRSAVRVSRKLYRFASVFVPPKRPCRFTSGFGAQRMCKLNAASCRPLLVDVFPYERENMLHSRSLFQTLSLNFIDLLGVPKKPNLILLRNSQTDPRQRTTKRIQTALCVCVRACVRVFSEV
jgi:hypothetical protein